MAAASALQQNAITTYQDIVAAAGMTIVAFFPTSGNIVSRDAIWAFDNTSSYDAFTSCRISISLSPSNPGTLVSTTARHFKPSTCFALHIEFPTDRVLVWQGWSPRRFRQTDALRTYCNCFQLSRRLTLRYSLSSSKYGRKSEFQSAFLAL